MHHYVNSIDDTKGNALIGFFVRCVDSTTGLSATLYADTSLTPILSVSGLANAAQVNADGNADFYVALGTYHLDIYATDGTTFVRRIQNIPMVEDVLPPSATTIGLFTGASLLTIGSSTTLVQTSGYSVLDKGAAVYVYDAAVDSTYVAAHPKTSFLAANGTGFRLSHEQDFIPQMFGALADGTTDDSAAFVAAIAFLKAFAINYGNGAYGSSPKLFIPAGHYYVGSTALDINHTIMIEGEGSGWLGSGAYGVSRLRWAAGSSGFRVQGALTSGTTTVDGVGHDGSGGAVLRNLCLQGGYAGTEGEFHGLVLRNAARAEDLYIINWQGEGVKAWAGVVDGTNYGGNVSTTRLVGIKSQGNRGGFDIRGVDANVCTTINCEAFFNRQFGYLDNNGSGSNTVIGMHCASNGLANDGQPAIMCTSSSKYYAAKWGGTFTNAPSGSATDTADWLYVGTGSADAAHPAFTATPNTFRAGGDYLAIGGSVEFYNCYQEGGGFSQFPSTVAVFHGGTLPDIAYRGGRVFRPESDGYAIRANGSGSNTMHLDSQPGGFSAIEGRSAVVGGANTPMGSLTWTSGYTAFTGQAANTLFSTLSAGVATNRWRYDDTGLYMMTGVMGYDTGSGAAVTQLTSKSTATPAINKGCGQITMNNAALAGGAKVSFVVTNSKVAATDTIIVSVASGGTANAYRAAVTAISAGASFTITVENITGGSLSEAPVINFSILKAVAA